MRPGECACVSYSVSKPFKMLQEACVEGKIFFFPLQIRISRGQKIPWGEKQPEAWVLHRDILVASQIISMVGPHPNAEAFYLDLGLSES